MGRTEKSQGLAPPAIRKDIRAKQARHIINKVIPAILASNARARRGADSSELIADPGPATGRDCKKTDEGGEDAAYVKRKGQGRRKAKDGPDMNNEDAAPLKSKAKKSGKRRTSSLDDSLSSLTLDPKPLTPTPTPPPKQRTVKVLATDSLTAALTLSSATQSSKRAPNVCILNMASPLRPGGGVLLGATSQEEFLCARTTLLPSLKESFYRLPELGGVFTHDVLVFRGSGPLGENTGELGTGERFYVDVISAGMLRFPDLEGAEDEAKRLSKKDRGVVESKMRAVLRIAEAKGCTKLVLGAWGCGAYGNPVSDVAEAWSRVLAGRESGAKKGSKAVEVWPGLEEVAFAITNLRMARDFADAFGGGVKVEEGPKSLDEDEEQDEEEDKVAQELQAKITEMEGQISKVWNPDLKSRLGSVLAGLKAQLRERQGEDDNSEDGLQIDDDENSSVEQDDQMERHEDQAGTESEELSSDLDDVNSGVAVRP